jgi:hypothetical protein
VIESRSQAGAAWATVPIKALPGTLYDIPQVFPAMRLGTTEVKIVYKMKMIYVSELGHFLPEINHYNLNTSPMVVYMSANTDQPTQMPFFRAFGIIKLNLQKHSLRLCFWLLD